MTKEQIFIYLSENGYTNAAVNHPEFPKKIVLEHLELSNKDSDFKDYYKVFIECNFK